MNEMPLSWKLFRVLCIVQLLLIAFPLIGHLVSLFKAKHVAGDLISMSCYALVFLFVYQGLAIMNDNYPDHPLTVSQKRRFNLFFLANFLLIAFMFSKVVDTWWIIPVIGTAGAINWSLVFWLLGWLIVTVLSFIFHLLFLYGMYRLRQLIYKNTIGSWVNQFDQQEPK